MVKNINKNELKKADVFDFNFRQNTSTFIYQYFYIFFIEVVWVLLAFFYIIKICKIILRLLSFEVSLNPTSLANIIILNILYKFMVVFTKSFKDKKQKEVILKKNSEKLWILVYLFIIIGL